MGVSLIHLDPRLREGLLALEKVMSDNGLQYKLTSTVRSFEQQKFLYSRFIRGLSPLPAAPPGYSAHEYGWAFDLLVVPAEYQADVGAVWTAWGGEYGGNKDPVHFQLPGATEAAKLQGDQLASSTTGAVRAAPAVGGAFAQLADFLSGFVPVLGEVQLANALVTLFDGHEDLATWYLNHPAEALRDLIS